MPRWHTKKYVLCKGKKFDPSALTLHYTHSPYSSSVLLLQTWNEDKMLNGKLKGKDCLENLGADGGKALQYISRNQHQLDTLFLVCLLGVNASICFRRYSPIFRRPCTDAIWCNYVRRIVLTACRLRFHSNLHVVNTHSTYVITPNSICAEPPEDGRVTSETCRGIDS
jgi:hypothetical protein